MEHNFCLKYMLSNEDFSSLIFPKKALFLLKYTKERPTERLRERESFCWLAPFGERTKEAKQNTLLPNTQHPEWDLG